MKYRIATPVLLLVCMAWHADAMFLPIASERVPVIRIVSNLEKKSEADPKNASLHYQIGRFYAMSYAKVTDSLEVRSEYVPIFDDDSKLEHQSAKSLYEKLAYHGFGNFFGLPPGHASADPRYMDPNPGESDEEKRKYSERYIKQRTIGVPFLEKAIDRYKKALHLEPENLVFQLGYAWAADQLGDKTTAIPIYESILRSMLERQPKKPKNNPENFIEQMAAETRQYLITLVNPDMSRYLEIKALCDRVEQEIPPPNFPITPLLIPLCADRDLSQLQTSSITTSFNLDGLGCSAKWSWITPDAGWLVWDPDRTGRIESGRQLFGNVTFWVFWENGYDALAALDDDQNGSIEGDELSGLAIWRDANSNGISEPGEALPVADWNITSLACTHARHESGISWNPHGATFKNGELRATYDVILDPANNLDSSSSFTD